MLLLRKPTPETIRNIQESDRQQGVTLPHAGVTRMDSGPPGKWKKCCRSEIIGRGSGDFSTACALLDDWHMLKLGWTYVAPEHPPIESGTVLSVIAKIGLCYSINGAQIDAVIKNETEYSFNYVTLQSHDMCGEEKFAIYYDPTSEVVRYEILSYSKPSSCMKYLALPFVKCAQEIFLRQSCAAMRSTVPG